jgi:hypothetical protein
MWGSGHEPAEMVNQVAATDTAAMIASASRRQDRATPRARATATAAATSADGTPHAQPTDITSRVDAGASAICSRIERGIKTATHRT